VPQVRESGRRRHAAITRLKRRTKRTVMLLAVILAATYLLNFFFSFSSYLPKFYEPKDFDREMLLKKLDDFGTGSGPPPRTPPNPRIPPNH
jgi:hypothetical protein